jgi:hypothetical protein
VEGGLREVLKFVNIFSAVPHLDRRKLENKSEGERGKMVRGRGREMYYFELAEVTIQAKE